MSRDPPPDHESATQALRDSEELLRIATQNANLFTWEVDIATGHSRVSANAAAVVGFDLPAHLDQAIMTIHPDDREQVQNELDQAVRTGKPFHSDQRMVTPTTGAVICLRVDAVLIRDGASGRSRLVGISRNVTDEKLAEEALRESEERLRLASEAARMYAWEVDLDSGAVLTSPNAAEIRGFPSPLTMEAGDAQLHPDDFARMTSERQRVIEEGAALDLEYRLANPLTAEIAWFRSQGVVIRDDHGRPRRLVGMVQNITSRKNTEEALRRFAEQLELRVYERTAELLRSTGELEKALDDRARLLLQIVTAQEDERLRIARELHDEMGQPLTALQVGLGSLPTSAPDKLRQLMDIVSQIDHKVDRLAFEIRPAALTELGLEAAVRQLVEKFAGESGIDVDLHFDERMDRARLSDVVEGTLYRVLQEALTNVWRHAQATSVSIILDQRNHHAQMIIEDDGAGFDVEKVSTGRFGLLGIRERVALVGGTVNIESTLRGGTTLFVRVPIEKRGIQ